MGNTRQRQLILDCLKQAGGHHMTVEDVLQHLKATEKKVGKATVYRFLKDLERDGEVQRYCSHDGQPACYRYVPAGQCGHYHMVCDNCGKLLHLELDGGDQLAAEVKARYGFVIDEAKTVFYGRCAACAGEVDAS